MPGTIRTDPKVTIPRESATPRETSDAISRIAAQAYAPFTLMATSTGNETAVNNSWLDVPGLSLNIVVPVPSQARIHALLDTTCDTFAAGELVRYQILKNGTSLGTGAYSVWQAGATNNRDMIPMLYLDGTLFPGTLYAYKIQMSLTTGTTARYTANTGRCRLLIATEAVQRIA